MKIEKFNADNSRFGVVLSEVMKNHHVSGSDRCIMLGCIRKTFLQSKRVRAIIGSVFM